MLYRPTVNLLPDNKKDRLKILVKFVFAKDLLEMSMLFYSLLAIVFIWSWLSLLTEYNNTALSTTLVNRENSTRNRQARETNNIIRRFNRAAAGYAPLTPELKDIINTLPDGIKLSQISIDRQQNEINLTGTAQTRAALLDYEKIVKGYPWLKNISSPVSQLFEKENINFEINAELGLPATLSDSKIQKSKR